MKPALGNWLVGTLTDLSDWQSYYRATNGGLGERFFTNTFPVAPQPQTPAQDVLLALSKYDATIEELRAASLLRYSRFPLEYDKDNPAEILLPHLGALTRCSQCLELRAVAEIRDSQRENAARDAKLMLRLAGCLDTEQTFVTKVVRVNLVTQALQPVWEGMAQHKWTDTQLAELEAELANLDFVGDYRTSMRAEMVMFQGGTISYLRRHRGGLLSELGRDGLSVSGAENLLFHFIPSGWFYQNHVSCAWATLELYLPVADMNQHTMSPKLAQHADEVVAADLRGFKPFHKAEMFLPGLSKAAQKFAFGQSSVDLARVAIALERYRLAHGEYPEALEALVPTFLATLPHDVIGGRPLQYRRADKEHFLVYSVGWNEKDDGGTIALKEDGTLDAESGDWVWQMPAGR